MRDNAQHASNGPIAWLTCAQMVAIKYAANFAVDAGQSWYLSVFSVISNRLVWLGSLHRSFFMSSSPTPSRKLSDHVRGAAALVLGFSAACALAQHSGHAAHGSMAAAPAATTASASADAAAVRGAWIRATVEGQKGTGGFMVLTSAKGAELVGVSSPVAGVSELHEMTMDGGVMKMQARASLALPAGVAVELKPGGYHLMLMDLNKTLTVGATVPVALTFKDSAGKTTQQRLDVPVAARAPGQSAAAAKAAEKGHNHGAHQH
jgi:periplasmic copper chaperone A